MTDLCALRLLTPSAVAFNCLHLNVKMWVIENFAEGLHKGFASMPEENGASPSREILKLPRIRPRAPFLAAIGWLGSLGGQVWVTVAWTWGGSVIALGSAEYAALMAMLIPILVGTTGYWIWRLRQRFGAAARFRELEEDIDDASECLYSTIKFYSSKERHSEDPLPRTYDLIALAWKLEKRCKIPVPPPICSAEDGKAWHHFLEQLSWLSQIGDLKSARKVWPKLQNQL